MLQNISQIVPPEQLKRSRFHPISCNYYSKSGYDTEMPSHHPIKEEMETEEAGNIGGGFEENSGTE